MQTAAGWKPLAPGNLWSLWGRPIFSGHPTAEDDFDYIEIYT